MRSANLVRPAPALRSVLGVSIAAIALSLAACSSSGGTAPTSAPVSPSAAASLPGASSGSTPAVQSPAASSSSPAPAASGGSTDTAASLTTKLLTPADVGAGFVEGTYDPKDSTSPCDPKGTPGVDEQVPPSLKVGRAFVQNKVGVQAEEDLEVFSDAATAAKAAAAAEKGLDCTSGSLYATDGTTVKITISAPSALNASGDVEGGDVWSIKGTQVIGTAVLIKYSGTHLALMTFLAPASADTSKLPKVETVVETAITKFLS